jgi:hypothetical protein
VLEGDCTPLREASVSLGGIALREAAEEPPAALGSDRDVRHVADRGREGGSMCRRFRGMEVIQALVLGALLTTTAGAVRGGRLPAVSSHSLVILGRLVAKAAGEKAGMR